MRTILNMLYKLLVLVFLTDWANASCTLSFIDNFGIDEVLVYELPIDTSAGHIIEYSQLKVT